VKTIELVSTGGGPHRFKVEKAAAKAGIFAVKVKAAEEGKRYQLEISIPKAPEKQRYVRDVIEVHTDDPEVPDISFPAMAQF
jgi:hypothetical protein